MGLAMADTATHVKQAHEYSVDEIERQYNVRMARPDFDTHVIPAWNRRSAAFRDTSRPLLDLAYGHATRERLDIFRARGPDTGRVLIFFHGGYWQRLDKSVFSFVAQPFVDSGVSVVLANYDLCPGVRIGDIIEQARRAVSWIWMQAPDLGLARERMYVMGHSAGGHLAAMMAATQWPQRDGRLPANLVKGSISISGLFELAPLLRTSINRALGMDRPEALAASPIHHLPVTNAPHLIACGEREPAEFHRQADAYAQACRSAARAVERYTVPDSDHMDELDVLAQERSIFFQRAWGLLNA